MLCTKIKSVVINFSRKRLGTPPFSKEKLKPTSPLVNEKLVILPPVDEKSEDKTIDKLEFSSVLSEQQEFDKLENSSVSSEQQELDKEALHAVFDTDYGKHSNEKRFELMKKLLNNKICDLNAEDENGNTVLHRVVSERSPQENMIEALIEAGASVKVKNKSGQTAFEICFQNHILKFAKHFIKAEANPDVERNGYFSKETILGEAVMLGELELVKLLILKKVNIHLQHECGRTALMTALSFGKLEIAKLLVSIKSVNASDKYGKTPIMYVAEKRDPEFTDLFN